MTQVIQYKLSQIYQMIFNRFRKGEYLCFKMKSEDCMNRMKPAEDEEQDKEKRKPKKPLSEAKAHEAAVDFITFLFCANRCLKYHYNYYKRLYVPWEPSKISLQGVNFQDFIDFISPETKKTTNK